ncbi:MAG: PhnD/SsuA/transferrin family substrate-binding protein [Pseudomonadota bacterium]|nr:PhnD/SsuA/transferrin family substrate-binding protein [Pseudomonadota bacterium]
MRPSGSKKWRISRLVTVLWLGIALLLWSLAPLSATPTQEVKIVKIGVRALNGVEAARKKWSATATYLTQAIEGYRFAMIPIVDFADMEAVVEESRVDFVLTNPTAYIALKESFNVSRILTLVNNVGGKGEKQFGGVIFARADRTGILERLAEKGKINLTDFTILGLKTDEFIYPHSTRLYPEWPLAKLDGTADELTRKVAVALMTMPEKHPAALAGGYVGWLPPLHYNAVENLMKELRVGPYKNYGQVTYVGAAKKLGQWILLFVVFASGFFLAILYKKRKLETLVGTRTRELQIEKDKFEQSANRLFSVFRAAPTGIGVVVDRVLNEVNERFCAMLGYTQAELLGENARIVYPTDEEFESVGREKYRQISERGTGTVETRMLRKDGKLIDVLLSSPPLNLNDLSAGVTFTALDITERKRTETELEKYQKHLETLVKEQTAALEEKVAELESMNDVFIGREFRIKELRERVNEMELKVEN